MKKIGIKNIEKSYMTEKNIKKGKIYFIKKSCKRQFTISNTEFLIVRILYYRQNRPTRYFKTKKNKKEYVYANELTEIQCALKKCPCH